MSRRYALVSGLSAIAAVVVVAVDAAGADDRWVEVVPSAPGTRSTIEVRDRPGGLAIEADLAGFFARSQTVDARDFVLLEVPGFGGTGEIGGPHLPFKTVLVPVVSGPSAALRVTTLVERSVLTGVTVMPEQPPMPECGSAEPDFVIDREAYASDAWFSPHAARIAQDAVVRGQRFLVVEVFPLSFNPARAEVVAREHLRIEIDLVGGIDVAAEMRTLERRNPHFPTMVEGAGTSIPDANPTGIEYLIIAADPLVAAVEPLAGWKRLKGLTVEVVAMSAIGATSAELKAFLEARYDADPDLTYVLLVGDHPMVPTEDLGNLVSDLYYSCLDGSDYFPDIVLGRIAVETPADCGNVVAKILAFDRDVIPGPWHGAYLMAAQFQAGGDCHTLRWFFETGTHAMHYVRDVIGMDIFTAAESGDVVCNPYVWAADHVIFPHRPPGYANQPVPQVDANLITSAAEAAQDVVDAFNAGVGIVQHRDHGAVTGWIHPWFWNTDVAALANGAMTPVVYSTNCLTGAFSSAEDCLAEALMKKHPGGAVGVMAATEASTSGYNDLMVHGAYDCFWDDYDTDDGGNIYPHSFRPAEAWLYGKAYMYTWEGHGATTQRSFELFHWHGDPEIRAFTAVPTYPAVSLDPTIEVGTSTMTIDVDADGALVAVTDGGTLLGRSTVVAGVADVTLDPAPSEPGTLDVVVTGHNLVPWLGTCEVVRPAAIFADDFESGGTGAWSHVQQ
jgi:hypothetical protein